MIPEALQIAAGLVVAATAGRQVNLQGPRVPALNRIAWSIAGMAGLMASIAGPLSRVPAVTNFQVEMVEHRPGVIRQHAFGFKPKYQAKCDFINLDAYVLDNDGRQLKVPLVMEDTPAPGRTRPPGLQDFGVWRLVYPPQRSATQTLFVAQHQCAWWMPLTSTTFGPFPVARPRVEEPAQPTHWPIEAVS